MPRRSARLNPQPSQQPSQRDYELIPIIQPGTRKADGSIVTIQEYYTNVSKNSIKINKAARDGIDLTSSAYSAPINQPRPIIGVAQQPEIEEDESPEQEVEQEETPEHARDIMVNIYRIFRNGIARLQQNRTDVSNQQQRSERILTSRERRERRIKKTLEQNINTLYNVNNNLFRFFNTQQLLYLAKNNIIENYYYRRLELYYTNSFLEKFNNLAYNILINMSQGVNENGYRYDIEYFNTIQGYYTSITGKVYKQNRRQARFDTINGVSGDKVVLHSKTRTIQNIIREIEREKSNEVLLLNNYIRHLDTLLQQPDITGNAILRSNINIFKERLNKRLRKLNSISNEDLQRLFSTEQYENKRKNLIYILKSLSILCITFMIIIYKIKFFVTSSETASRVMPEVSQEMYEAIEYFSRVINRDISIRTSASINEMKSIIIEQETLFTNIKRNVVNLAGIINQDVGNDNYLDFSIYINNDSSRLDTQNREILRQQLNQTEFETRNRENLERLERRRQLVIERYNNINAERQQRREQRTAAQQAARVAARQAREAASQAREAARQAARQAREAARQTGQQPARQTGRARRDLNRVLRALDIIDGPQARGVYTINEDNIIKVENDAYDNKIILDDINVEFKSSPDSVINKLKTKYNEYNKKLNERDRIGFYNALKKKFQTYFNIDERVAPIPIIRKSIRNHIGYSIVSLFSRYIENGYDMKFNDLSKYFVINYSINSNGGNITRDRQAGIDVGGLRRDFITSLINELFNNDNGIFMTREGTKKYFLNPNFVPNEFYRYIINDLNSSYDYNNFNRDFYKFLGELISFILVNDCGLENYLSSYLIASLSRTTPFDDIDYVYFMWEDFPEYTTTLINLLKGDPNNIEYVYIGFNDYFNIDEEDKELNKDNIEEFIIKCAKYMMTKTIIRKEIDNIPTGTSYDSIVRNGEIINNAFVNGIPQDIKNYISSQKVPLLSINTYLIKPLMSVELINKLIQNFRNSMSSRRGGHSRLGDMVRLFIEYVLNNKYDKDEPVYFKYIENLIKFWSGSSFYKENENYKIDISTTLSDMHLPQSHTCFFTIDIPLYTGNDSEIGRQLHDKIEIAISNVEEGIGLAGGGKIVHSKSKIRK
jgi:hypothetical protein